MSHDKKKEIFNDNRIEGRNPVLEVLKTDRDINKILIANGNRDGSINKIISIAKEKGIVIQYVEKSVIEKLSTTNSAQGIIADVSVKNYVELDDILNNISNNNKVPFLIILDGITDPQNLGAIIRTAETVGVQGIVIPKRRSVGLNSIVSKVSAGAVEHVSVSRVVNISNTIDYLKEKNIWIVGSDIEDGEVFYKSDLKIPLALVIGGEGKGISRLVKEKCDFTVNIPMVGKISSLNASVAGALIMYEIFRQRGIS
ncbi:MAG: 23S rRNA (guanosine(2251)-2'-O)-methyltransferase RlmB [Clostridiales bacterium]